MGDEIILAAATAAPEAAAAAADYSEILSRLDNLININYSIYAWIALFITFVTLFIFIYKK